MRHLVWMTLLAACAGGSDDPTSSDTESTPSDASESDDSDSDDADTDASDTDAETSYDLWINEFMASNQTSYEEGGSYPDWIEVYNAGDSDVNLEGFFVTDDLTQIRKHEISGEVTVVAGGFVLLFADNDPLEGFDHLSFKLSADGEEIGLYSPSGDHLDKVVFGTQSTDVSAARVEDGSNEEGWEYVAGGTPGESNN